MPGFTPGRRWQPAYYPFKRETMGPRILETIERMTKGPLFGCRMCGNCLLQETAFICPMECPKGVRNGPCGGSTEEHCYVDETRPCIWYQIYDRAFRMGGEEMLLEVLPPLDWDKVGGETWGDVVHQVRKVGLCNVVKGMASRRPCHTGTDLGIGLPAGAPAGLVAGRSRIPRARRIREPVSELERRLKAGEFVVTAEVAPPHDRCDQEADPEYRDGQAVRGGDQLHRQPIGHAAHVELGVQHASPSRTAPSR